MTFGKAAMPHQALRNSQRQWLRLSMRGLLVLVLVIGTGMGWIVRQARIQREAVEAIDNLGEPAHASYDSDPQSGSPGKRLPGWKKRIAEYIGIDYVDHVAVVTLKSNGKELDWQQAVNRLGDLRQVRLMNLMGRHVNDDVLSQLEGMNGLELLMLQYTGVSDAGLAHVQNLTNLKTVYISGTGTSDACLAHLKGLTKLSDLSLHGKRVSDAGLVHLRGLANLSELSLSGIKVSDAGLTHLKGLTRLSRLDLRHAQVSEAGLLQLKGLTNLWRLELDYNIQDTDDGIKVLRQALPRLTIEYSF
jgi:uncharacterized protein YjbI with pentapeptide repeats